MIAEFELKKNSPLVENCFKIIQTIDLNGYTSGTAYKKFIVEWSEYKRYVHRKNEFIFIDRMDCEEAVKKMILDNGFKIDDTISESNNEIYYGRSIDETQIIEPFFDIHQDDFGGMNCPIVTCIIYLNVCCSGGQLEFYHNDMPETKCYRSIETQNPSEETCKVVIFDGLLFHNAAKYYAGHRYAISFQFPRDTQT
jgi:hypothetical protein